MDGIMTVAELRAELADFADDSRVMLAVVKYPGEIMQRPITEAHRWHLGTDVEIVPLEHGDVLNREDQCWLTVELAEYNEERAMLNGSQVGPG